MQLQDAICLAETFPMRNNLPTGQVRYFALLELDDDGE